MRGRVAVALFFGIALPRFAYAHTVSISTGELRVDGPTAVFELRIPIYEVGSIQNPETTLLDHIRFGDGHRTSSSCRADGGMYVCTANYEFPTPIPDKLAVECTFYQVTAPNHIHLLTAEQGKNQDQIVFDQTLPKGEVRFRPPSPAEMVARDLTNGVYRQVTSPASLLLLLGIALAARSWKQAAGMVAVLMGVEWISPLAAAKIPTTFSPQFLESAVSLAVAYLAVEILFLPDGGGRWAAVVGAGAFEGVMFAGFPKSYLAGANLIQIAGVAAFTLVAVKLRPRWIAGLLLVSAVVWFGTRLLR